MEDIFDVFEEILTDDEEDLINIIETPRLPRNFRARSNHFEMWDDQEFLHRFRISKESFRYISDQIQDQISHPTNRNFALSAATQLLITLRFYATGNMLITAGDFGGVHKATASRVVHNTSRAIALLSPQYIKMPETDEEIERARLEFYNIARFPRCIGAIDYTHVRIQSPGGQNAEHFRNRKGYFSINVQTISDAKLRVNNIVARWPGASHDSTIFNNSRVKAYFEEGRFQDSFLLGDSGYDLTDYLMTPLHNPHTPAESLYNESQIRTRNVVERKYGVWKRRFPILSFGMRLNIDTVLVIIVATAVLHNICVDYNIDEPDGPEEPDEPNEENIEDVVPEPRRGGNYVRQNLITQYFGNL